MYVNIATDWLALLASLLGTLLGVCLGVKLSLNSFYTQKWWEKKADAYLVCSEILYKHISDLKQINRHAAILTGRICIDPKDVVVGSISQESVDEFKELLQDVDLHDIKNKMLSYSMLICSKVYMIVDKELDNYKDPKNTPISQLRETLDNKNSDEIFNKSNEILNSLKSMQKELELAIKEDLRVDQSSWWKCIKSICEEDNQKFK